VFGAVGHFSDCSRLLAAQVCSLEEGLLGVPSDVTVHTSNPAVELLHAL
jgi:hypothetical protein